jgi:hypothetical protein
VAAGAGTIYSVCRVLSVSPSPEADILASTKSTIRVQNAIRSADFS